MIDKHSVIRKVGWGGSARLFVHNLDMRRALMRNRTALSCLAFACLLFLQTGLFAGEAPKQGAETAKPVNAGKAKQQIEAEGYTYTYEAVPTPSEDKTETYYVGRITIQDEDNNVFYNEITGLDPRPGECGNFPMMSSLPIKTPLDNDTRWVVVFCGSHGLGM